MRIPRTNGIQRVGVYAAGLEKIQLPIELELIGVKEKLWQSRHRHCRCRESALISDVVNRQECLDAEAAELLAEIDGNEPSLPIIAVDDLRSRFEPR